MRYLFLISALLLSGCGLFSTKLPVPVAIQHEKLDIAPASPLVLDGIQFIVINPDNAAQVFAEMEKNGQVPSLFGLDETNYNNWELNNQKIQNRLFEDKTREEQIKKYYEQPLVTFDGKQQ